MRKGEADAHVVLLDEGRVLLGQYFAERAIGLAGAAVPAAKWSLAGRPRRPPHAEVDAVKVVRVGGDEGDVVWADTINHRRPRSLTMDGVRTS